MHEEKGISRAYPLLFFRNAIGHKPPDCDLSFHSNLKRENQELPLAEATLVGVIPISQSTRHQLHPESRETDWILLYPVPGKPSQAGIILDTSVLAVR